MPDRLMETTADEVRAAVADWERFAQEAGVTKASRAEIVAAIPGCGRPPSALSLGGLHHSGPLHHPSLASARRPGVHRACGRCE